MTPVDLDDVRRARDPVAWAVRAADTGEAAVARLWQLSADVGDLVELAGALGVLERER